VTRIAEDLFAHVGRRIRDLRKNFNNSQGISQELLAEELGEPTNTVSRWETGVYKPNLADLEKLSRFFGISILTFFPKESVPHDEQLMALLRAAKELDPRDLEELRRFAEFRRAQAIFTKRGRKKAK
jgi:transcriptional regulator with XRE-family HTH domain